jgi:MerR family transcriptional regulator, mercuric resistance operon regulatory protein
MNSSNTMTIGDLARAGGVGVETIRYYQRLKLLENPARIHGTVRRYGTDALERVQFIKRAQRLAFSLSEIKIFYSLDAKRDRHRAHGLAKSKLQDIERQISDLAAMKYALGRLITACEAGKPNIACPIVEAFRHPR